jgi:uncharacterized damage-inducible protein DinB
MPGFQDHFAAFADYNIWANRRLYDVCGELPESEYKKQRPSFFRSIHGTLNHILLTDRLWLTRLEGGETPSKPGGIALGEELYGELAELRTARLAEDARISRLVEDAADARYAEMLPFRDSAGGTHEHGFAILLANLFNHQTHHRGQVHDQLSQTDLAPPPLDLFLFLRERAPAATSD